MAEHVLAHAQMEEEQMAEPMNTLTVSASQTTCKNHCDCNAPVLTLVTLKRYMMDIL